MAKKTKKKSKAVAKVKKEKLVSFDVSDILADKAMKDFDLELMSHDETEKIPYIIPFRHIGLNKQTGGIIGGTMCEISGDSGSFKSFLLYDLMVNTLDMGGAALLNDIENAFQIGYMKKAGMGLKTNMALTRTSNINKFFKLARNFIKAVRKKDKKCPILIGVDSFAGFKTAEAIDHEEAEKEKKDQGYAAMRKNATFSQRLDNFIAFIGKHDATFVLINQTRHNHKVLFGDDRYSLAENVIGYWCTQRLRGKINKKISKEVPSLKNKTKTRKIQTGAVAEWETIKNRFFVPFQKIETTVLFRTGLLRYSGLDEVLVNEGYLSQGTKSVTKKDSKGKDKKKTIKGYRDKDNNFYLKVKEYVDSHPECVAPTKIEDMPTSLELSSDETIEDEDSED